MQSKTVAFCERMYGWLLKAYPPSHRVEYGEAMAQAFRDLCRDACARHGTWGLLKVVLFTLADAVPSLVAEYTAQEARAMLKRILNSQISFGRLERSIGPIFAMLGAGVLALALHRFYEMHLDGAPFWLGALAATTLALLFAVVGLLVHVLKRWNIPVVQYRRAPGQMLRYFINAPGLCYTAGTWVLVGSVYKLGELRLTEAELLIGLLIALALSMLFIALGLLLNIAKPHNKFV